MSFFPPNWEELAFQSGAMTRMRKLKSPEALLRTLLLHVGHGYSMRETVSRAKDADIADFSDVALLKRLKKNILNCSIGTFAKYWKILQRPIYATSTIKKLLLADASNDF